MRTFTRAPTTLATKAGRGGWLDCGAVEARRTPQVAGQPTGLMMLGETSPTNESAGTASLSNQIGRWVCETYGAGDCPRRVFVRG